MDSTTPRTLIVSNRLPFTVAIEEEGHLTFRESAGGLASGLSAYLDSLKRDLSGAPNYVWVGWPGVTVEDEEIKRVLRAKAHADFASYPVFLSAEAMDKFYHGFCNNTIWPLFHYFPTYAEYEDDYWADYQRVNEVFCEAVMEIARPGDTIWVHDYHLMLLPRLIRDSMARSGMTLPIGFFLHIPFPNFEMFRLLPGKWRGEILEGLLGADLIGLHTPEYTQHLLGCMLRILGYEHHMGRIEEHDHIVKAATFPMGIDFQRFHSTGVRGEGLGVSSHSQILTPNPSPLTPTKTILSIDRLDYTKGVARRLHGYELFLERNPDWHKRVVLNLLITPSRTGVERYQQTKQQIEELVGRINGRFGNFDWAPIAYQYRFYAFESLVALYASSDVALVTPLRDGMNLIAKEYVASRVDGTGVLILSEMAGAEKELGEAILINPNSTEEIADALRQALEMPEDEQVQRNRPMQDRLSLYNVVRWAEDFLSELHAVYEEQQDRRMTRLLQPAVREQMAERYARARRRLIFLDYDGTLVPFAPTPEAARPGSEPLDLLRDLAADPKNSVVLISGRDRATLENWFEKVPIGLVAEHGVWLRMPGEQPGQGWSMIRPLVNDWKPLVRPILELYAGRLQGSFVEEKEYSLVWHYRRADPELGAMRAKELLSYLVDFTARMDVRILQGSKVIEVKSAGVDKGAAGLYWLYKDDYDFIMAVGDDRTDEDLFVALPETAYTIKVGMGRTNARFYLLNRAEVPHLLTGLLSEC